MSFKCGIVGLPNVGKSTLFNALTNSSKAQAENFPFCTIEPNIGIVPVLDKRLDKLSEISKSKKKIYTTISFIDIAGLVKGASKGEGLGNKFLSHIREVDAVIHMIRCFDSEKIQNVNQNIDPLKDFETIETEMKLADLESIDKRLEKKNRKNIDEKQLKILEMAYKIINNGENANKILKEFELKDLKSSGLLSIKPKIFVCNVDENSVAKGNSYTDQVIDKFGEEKTIIISAEIENQMNQLDNYEKKSYMELVKIKDSGLNNLIKKGYEILELDTFFTAGPEESRAWTIKKKCLAPKAAGEIHSDFEKGFIRAETVSYSDFIECNGWPESKNKGKMRLEGKDYIVKDGDILNFRFNT